ncbi:hypothetical protein BpHYR1_028152 [Brachionus plicatilis]|uniref:Uncharacterized protein n=1 Tax=Brachionus plicatilis TaxID=10195 RepID=A0A3M7PJH3_BRAPC|nr:hypothetical protein BpHYR1_028152 [Brachionus plicatilis]
MCCFTPRSFFINFSHSEQAENFFYSRLCRLRSNWSF